MAAPNTQFKIFSQLPFTYEERKKLSSKLLSPFEIAIFSLRVIIKHFNTTYIIPAIFYIALFALTVCSIVFVALLAFNSLFSSYPALLQNSDVLLYGSISVSFTIYIASVYLATRLFVRRIFSFKKNSHLLSSTTVFRRSVMRLFTTQLFIIPIEFTLFFIAIQVPVIPLTTAIILHALVQIGIMAWFGFYPFFIVIEQQDIISALAKSRALIATHFPDHLRRIIPIQVLITIPFVTVFAILESNVLPISPLSNLTTSVLLSLLYIAGSYVFWFTYLTTYYFNLRLWSQRFRSRVHKVFLWLSHFEQFGVAIVLGLLLASYAFSLSLVSLSPSAIMTNVESLHQSVSQLYQEPPVPTIKGTDIRKAHYTVGETIEYGDITYTLEEFRVLKAENVDYALCVADIVIQNFGETYYYSPQLSTSLQQKDQQIPPQSETYYDANYFILDPTNIYTIQKGFSLPHSLVFGCSAFENLTNTAEFGLTFLPIRQKFAQNSVTNEDFESFRLKSQQREYTQAAIEFRFNLVDQPQIAKSIIVDSQIPVVLEDVRISRQETEGTLRCSIQTTLFNQSRYIIPFEYYHLQLIGRDGQSRALSSNTGDFTTASLSQKILPQSRITFTTTYNCDDNSPNYTVQYTPFFDFGPFVTTNSTQVIV